MIPYFVNLLPNLVEQQKKKTGSGFCKDLNLLEKLVFEYLLLVLLERKLDNSR